MMKFKLKPNTKKYKTVAEKVADFTSGARLLKNGEETIKPITPNDFNSNFVRMATIRETNA